MTKKAFLDWHVEWVKQFGEKSDKPPTTDGGDHTYCRTYGCRTNYYPDNMSEWYDFVEEAQANLRKKLGGPKKQIKVIIDEDSCLDNYEGCKHYINSVVSILPDYLKTYKLQPRDLAKPNLKAHKNIRTTKHILGYAERINLSADNTVRLKGYVDLLGNMMKGGKLIPGAFDCLITTEQQAFSFIGRYDINNNSCFGQGKFNSDKKYAFATVPNAFVVLVRRHSEEGFTPESRPLIMRCMGVITEMGQVVNFLNAQYAEYDYNRDQYIRAEVAKTILECDDVCAKGFAVKLKGGINYSADESSYWDAKNKTQDWPTQTISISTRYSIESHPVRDQYANR